MEFESTLQEAAPVVETVLLYDKDGRIVYAHDFIGDGTGLTDTKARAERERIAKEDAKQLPNAPKQVKVLHLERGFRPEPGTMYRVDVAKGKLVVHRRVAVGLGSVKARGKGK